MHYVTIPGIDGSDHEHWQSIWEAEWGQRASRISVSSWTRPELGDWCDAIDRAVAQARSPGTVLVAHSLGCLAAVRWAARRRPGVAGVFLVAPPDQAGPLFPAVAGTFAAAAEGPVDAAGLIVSGDNDPYCSSSAAGQLAAAWALPRVTVGPVGHVNSASGLGRWDTGHALLTAFTAGLRADRGWNG
jgi:predicted alpha/beta hydrolase family esterase